MHAHSQVYKREADSFGLVLGECSHSLKEFSFTSLSGDYRRVLVRPKELTWKLLLYTDLQQDLAHTDLGAVLGKPQPDIQELLVGESCYCRVMFALGAAHFAMQSQNSSVSRCF